jgi:hypothetical protein
MKTKVIFRRFKDDGSIIALFPDEIADMNNNCMSYQHIGQHGAADYNYCIKKTIAATPLEYEPLKRELKTIGYELDIKLKHVKRWIL